ncbi:uncharacterized protein BKA78DRAFT_312761 [Phyllosticta capitalensis]|uniref:uncharacterized protein n=1 Tax=Phyllosticta capitalensis TaxID=121624 RepID=UPI00312F97FA
MTRYVAMRFLSLFLFAFCCFGRLCFRALWLSHSCHLMSRALPGLRRVPCFHCLVLPSLAQHSPPLRRLASSDGCKAEDRSFRLGDMGVGHVSRHVIYLFVQHRISSLTVRFTGFHG